MKKWIFRGFLLLALIAAPFLAYQAVYHYNTGDPSQNPFLKNKEYVCRIWITDVLSRDRTVFSVQRDRNCWNYTKFRSEPSSVFKGYFNFAWAKRKLWDGGTISFAPIPPPILDGKEVPLPEFDDRHALETERLQKEIFSKDIGKIDYPGGSADEYVYTYYFKIKDQEVRFCVANIFDEPITRKIENLYDFTTDVQRLLSGP